MNGYDPMTLPPVSAVVVLDLRGVGPYPVAGYLNAAGVPEVTVSGPAAERVAVLWRRLTPGHAARCHTPPFGLRFVASEVVVCQASVCWACNTIYGTADGAPFFHAFDADGEAARALLTELDRIADG